MQLVGEKPEQAARPGGIGFALSPPVLGCASEEWLAQRQSGEAVSCMMVFAGTVPLKDLDLTAGAVSCGEECLLVDGRCVGAAQGMGATFAAALSVAAHLRR